MLHRSLPWNLVEPKPLGLPMPDQDFTANFVDPAAPGIKSEQRSRRARWFVWGTALFLGLTFAGFSIGSFGQDGSLPTSELLLVTLTALLFMWECLPALTALLGLITKPPVAAKFPAQNLSVAILVTIYDEDAEVVIGNASKLLQQLSTTTHVFTLHILSDSRKPGNIIAEKLLVQNATVAINYHHRSHNIDHKSGNIREWVMRHGAVHDAMLVLDADSIMTSDSVLKLTDTLAAEPSCGLVQTLPSVLRGNSLWQWTQSFATQIYGQALGQGLARWMGDEANYYGHNAIIRTKAFASCAGLPRLRNAEGPGETIMSHDFVEAALLRRAGWGVRILPDLQGSFEETPATLIGFIKRDQRWCHGNLQHLQILSAAGLHGLSRWHFFHGAMTYVTSVIWFATILLWAGLGMTAAWSSTIFLMLSVIGIVLASKLFGLLNHVKTNPLSVSLMAAVLAELALSTLVAPTLMVQRIRMIMRYASGASCPWLQLSTGRPGILATLRFHIIETMVGIVLLMLSIAGVLSFFIAPLALCLVASPALSLLLSRKRC